MPAWALEEGRAVEGMGGGVKTVQVTSVDQTFVCLQQKYVSGGAALPGTREVCGWRHPEAVTPGPCCFSAQKPERDPGWGFVLTTSSTRPCFWPALGKQGWRRLAGWSWVAQPCPLTLQMGTLADQRDWILPHPWSVTTQGLDSMLFHYTRLRGADLQGIHMNSLSTLAFLFICIYRWGRKD